MKLRIKATEEVLGDDEKEVKLKNGTPNKFPSTSRTVHKKSKPKMNDNYGPILYSIDQKNQGQPNFVSELAPLIFSFYQENEWKTTLKKDWWKDKSFPLSQRKKVINFLILWQKKHRKTKETMYFEAFLYDHFSSRTNFTLQNIPQIFIAI